MKRNTKKCYICEKQISLSNISRHELSHQISVAWNARLTKDSDKRVAKIGRSISKLMQLKAEKGILPKKPKLSKEYRLNLSERMSKYNPGGKSKWFEINGEKVQGTWEFKIASKMLELKISWTKRNQQSWTYIDKLEKQRRYTPDFFLIEFEKYLEIKGFWWGNDKEKMDLVLKQNPDLKIKIIEKDLYEKLLEINSKQEFIQLLEDNASVADEVLAPI